MLIFMVALELPIISNYNETLLISLGYDVAFCYMVWAFYLKT